MWRYQPLLGSFLHFAQPMYLTQTRFVLLHCALLALTLWQPAAVEGLPPQAEFEPLETARALHGTEQLTILAPEGATFAAYQNHGYRMEERTARNGKSSWRVTIDLAPIESNTPFVLPVDRSDSGLETLARSLVVGSHSRYGAVSRVLAWVSRNIHYDLDRSEDQSAQAVLERRSGYCTGVARLAVSVLAAVGIEAREVSGYVVPMRPGETGGYHRWIEVNYPDRGWVFSDPLKTHHFVPANYLRLAAEELDLTRSHRARILSGKRSVVPVDVYPMAPQDVLARRNGRRQRAATISLAASGEPSGYALLSGNGEQRALRLERGRGAFVGLRRGTYDLSVVLESGTTFRRSVTFRNLSHRHLEVPAAGPAAAGGGAP